MPESLHPIYHFTRVENLATIVEHGLLADTFAAEHLQIEVGNRNIKDARTRRRVPIGPGGVVADYVPFYYAPRSPMMYAIYKGNVPTYTDGCDRLIYLVSSLESLWLAGADAVGTDRNARLDLAEFYQAPVDVVGAVDWPLMLSEYWNSTAEDPDRRERRQAEFLVHRHVPWSLIDSVCAHSPEVARSVQAVLADVGDNDTKVFVSPTMYF